MGLQGPPALVSKAPEGSPPRACWQSVPIVRAPVTLCPVWGLLTACSRASGQWFLLLFISFLCIYFLSWDWDPSFPGAQAEQGEPAQGSRQQVCVLGEGRQQRLYPCARSPHGLSDSKRHKLLAVE